MKTTKQDFKKVYQRMVNAQRAALFSGFSTEIGSHYTEANKVFGQLNPFSLEFILFTGDGIMKAMFATYRLATFDEEMTKIENFLQRHGNVA